LLDYRRKVTRKSIEVPYNLGVRMGYDELHEGGVPASSDALDLVKGAFGFVHS